MKPVLAITIVVVFVGLAVWFFIQQAKKAQDMTTINQSQSPTPAETVSQNSTGQLVTLPGGLQVQDIVIGPGQEARTGTIVATHYTGTLVNGTKFDSSYDRGQPFSFILGAGQVIKGWDQGIVGMKVGGKRKLIVPAVLGYGNRDVGNGKIPANSTLIFEVELVGVEEVKTQR